MLYLGTAASLGAQNPFRHPAEAVESRFARSQPVVGYVLRIDSADFSGFSVEMRIRNAPDTLRLAMFAHPEYDDRYFRYVEGAGLHTGDRLASVNGATVGTSADLRNLLARLTIGDPLRLEVRRPAGNVRVSVPIVGYDRPFVVLEDLPGAAAAAKALRAQWLAGR